MKQQTPPWVLVAGVVVQVAALGFVTWAMESSLKRGRALTGSVDPSWSPETPPSMATPPTRP